MTAGFEALALAVEGLRRAVVLVLADSLLALTHYLERATK